MGLGKSKDEFGGKGFPDGQACRRRHEVVAESYERNYNRIFRYCLGRLYDRAIAEDVAASTFLTFAQNAESFVGEKDDNIARWLFTVARNSANGYLRKSARRKDILAKVWKDRKAGFDRNVDGRGFVSADWPVLYEALMKLKPGHRDVVLLHFFEGLDASEIADLLDIKPASVRVTRMRALRKMRIALNKTLDSSGGRSDA